MNNTVLTIVIPSSGKLKFENQVKFAEGNKEIFLKYPIIIISKIKDEVFKSFSSLFFVQNTSFWFARRFGLEFVKTKYVLCLDTDTVLPLRYVEQSVEILENNYRVGAIALNYEEPYKQNHLAFGTSVWKTELLKELYDWKLTGNESSLCECLYMWKKLEKHGYLLETLSSNAKHLKNPLLNIHCK